MSETVEPIDLWNPPAEPWTLFRAWYAEAEASPGVKYAHAMCLATVDPDGRPDARTVLLKHLDDDGFVFFTDSSSPKGRDLEYRAEAALVFYWGPLDRQVRLRGGVVQAPEAISDACFEKRPRGSRIAAWASLQSRPLRSREELEGRHRELSERFEGIEAVPRPPHWQAYCVRPRKVEFWQASAHRLHDRLLYTWREESWETSWLYP